MMLYLALFLSTRILAGKIHIDKKLSEIKKKLADGEEVKGGLLTHLLVTQEMSLEEIYANMTEMLLAGVDTVREARACMLGWRVVRGRGKGMPAEKALDGGVG